MKLHRVHGRVEVVLRASVGVAPGRVLGLVYVGDDYLGQPLYDFWFWK